MTEQAPPPPAWFFLLLAFVGGAYSASLSFRLLSYLALSMRRPRDLHRWYGAWAVHYWIRRLCRVPAALGKGTFAVGKGFAECGSRQSPLGKEVVGKGIFAECHVAGTRQRICRVLHQHSAKVTGTVNLTLPFAECR